MSNLTVIHNSTSRCRLSLSSVIAVGIKSCSPRSPFFLNCSSDSRKSTIVILESVLRLRLTHKKVHKVIICCDCKPCVKDQKTNMFVSSRSRSSSLKLDESAQFAKPFCQCWGKNKPMPWQQLDFCSCGEENEVNEWNWESPDDVVESARSSWVLVSEDQKQVTFHPYYSSGTAAVRGDTPLMLNNHYYWEVKVLTQTYGTDIMVGLGTSKADMRKDRFKFISLLGQDAESYGLSYRGSVKHDAKVSRESDGFCRGSIVGVRLDMWRGTLQFYVNRKPQGVCFYNMRRHSALYPMLSSTAAQSSMRLIYAASWRASLLVDAAKVLASSVRQCNLPPGLLYTCKSQFWLTLPSEGDAVDDDDDFMDVSMEPVPTTSSSQLIETLVAGPYINGFYVDSVDVNSRIVIRQ